MDWLVWGLKQSSCAEMPLADIGHILFCTSDTYVTALVEVGWPVDGVEEKEHRGEGDQEEDVSLAIVIRGNWRKGLLKFDTKCCDNDFRHLLK